MKLHRRNRLLLALASMAVVSLIWLSQMTLPLLEEQTQSLQHQRRELQQRQQAATADIYQPLIERLQQPLPAPNVIIAALRKTSGGLDLADTSYSLAHPQSLERGNLALATRNLSIGLPKAEAATALALWQELRQALPCEVRLAGFNSTGPQARLELELIGAP